VAADGIYLFIKVGAYVNPELRLLRARDEDLPDFVGFQALAPVFGVTDPARAHGVLLESRPAAQETMTVARRLDVRFNSRIEPAFSEVRITAPSGKAMRLHAVVSEAAGPGRLTAALPPLEPGLYTVHWRIFTVDGHLSHGNFSFRVADRRWNRE
jgi:methionine-rich copper-binding protein CopC